MSDRKPWIRVCERSPEDYSSDMPALSKAYMTTVCGHCLEDIRYNEDLHTIQWEMDAIHLHGRCREELGDDGSIQLLRDTIKDKYSKLIPKWDAKNKLVRKLHREKNGDE